MKKKLRTKIDSKWVFVVENEFERKIFSLSSDIMEE